MRFAFLVLSVISLCSCGSYQRADFSGEWILTKILLDGVEIVPISYDTKILLLPPGCEGKQVITFNLTDSSCYLPGLNSFDVIAKWRLKADGIELVYDSMLFFRHLLASIEKFRPMKPFYELNEAEKKHSELYTAFYNKLRDSILSSRTGRATFSALNQYLGNYSIKMKSLGWLILESDHVRLNLTSSEYLFDKRSQEVKEELRR